MKKLVALLLAALMALGLGAALADAPAAGSLTVENTTIRGNTTWTLESYPEIWLTPIFNEYIIEGKDAEKYPPKFLCFAPPEGALPYEFDTDDAAFLNHDTLMSYGYYVADRASFELFLEKAEKENILADGSGGVAMFTQPDNRRARAMISLEEQYGGTAKLEILMYDNTGDMKAEELAAAIQAETERVQSTMRMEDLEGYWSKEVYASVQLYYSFLKVGVQVNTSAMTLVNVEDRKLEAMENVDGKAVETKIEIVDYTSDEVTDETLADGTPYIRKTYDSFSYGYFEIGESRDKPVYVSICIDGEPEGFAEKLEKVYALVTVLAE